jgi:uncharacterized protein YbaA (DUF1428 family)
VPYVDGYVLPISKKKVSAYRRIASQTAKLWRKHGAVEWVTFKSRAHRDKVNKKVMKDPKMREIMELDLPFNAKRMAYGGFKEIV